MRGLTPNPTKMEDLLLQELLQIADSEAPGELGSSNLQLLSQPLSQWKNVILWASAFLQFFRNVSELLKNRTLTVLTRPIGRMNCCCMQASQAFLKEQGEEEDTLLLVASQDYEKCCGLLMNSEDIQSAVVAQVPWTPRGTTTGQLIPGKRGPQSQCCIIGWMGELGSEQCYWQQSGHLASCWKYRTRMVSITCLTPCTAS